MGSTSGIILSSIAASFMLFTGFEWLVIIALGILILAIFAWLIIRYGPWGGSGGGGGTGAPPPGAAEVLELQTLIANAEATGSMSAEDCQRARDLVAAARAAGVPGTQLAEVQNKLNSLCD